MARPESVGKPSRPGALTTRIMSGIMEPSEGDGRERWQAAAPH